MHNGTARQYGSLIPHEERLLVESDNDSATVFEFMRRRTMDYCLQDHRKSLIEGCRATYSDLLEADPEGKFNIIISNGYLSFVFIHWRPFYILNREKGQETQH